MNETKLTSSFEVNKRMLDELFKIDVNFDMAGREMHFAGSDAKLYFVDSFMNTAVLERLLIFFAELSGSSMPGQIDAGRFAAEFVPFGETSVTDDVDTIGNGLPYIRSYRCKRDYNGFAYVPRQGNKRA